MVVNPQVGRIETEGDEIYYETRGRGRPLLRNILADEFKVITYGRRGQSRSTRRDPQNFEISPQSRDALAVLHAAGEASAVAFGSSSGGAIGLELARSQPRTVRALIAHEPSVLRVLPDADQWLTFFAQLYLTALADGPRKAPEDFMSSVVTPASMPDLEFFVSREFKKLDERQKRTASSEFGMLHELRPARITCRMWPLLRRAESVSIWRLEKRRRMPEPTMAEPCRSWPSSLAAKWSSSPATMDRT
jgi:pimeloyl-ACP methyl ester carboxylesterase